MNFKNVSSPADSPVINQHPGSFPRLRGSPGRGSSQGLGEAVLSGSGDQEGSEQVAQALLPPCQLRGGPQGGQASVSPFCMGLWALLAAPITGHLLGSSLGRSVPFSPELSEWYQSGGPIALNVSEEG